MKPRIAFSGVRISWLVLLRNAFLDWVALSAASRAATSSAARLARSSSAWMSAFVSRPSSSRAEGRGRSGCPCPSSSALAAIATTRREIPDVNKMMPRMPPRMPRMTPAMVSAPIANCIRVMSALRAVTMAVGLAARPATWRRSKSMVCLPASSPCRRELAAPVPTAARIRASSAISVAVVAATARSGVRSPSEAAAARSLARSGARRARVRLYGSRNSGSPVATYPRTPVSAFTASARTWLADVLSAEAATATWRSCRSLLCSTTLASTMRIRATSGTVTTTMPLTRIDRSSHHWCSPCRGGDKRADRFIRDQVPGRQCPAAR